MTEPHTATVQRAGNRDLAVDIYPPIGPSLRTAVILLHPGAWMFGHRRDLEPQALELAAHGFTAITAEYRLSPEAIWPAQLIDVTDVIAWTKQSAETLGIDPAKIALLGCSAGGHLALMAAPLVAAVVAIGAPPLLQLPPIAAGPNPIAALLGPEATAETARAASPLSHIETGWPPICLIGSTKDHLVPPDEVVALFNALEAADVPAALHLYHGHTHAFDALPSMLGLVQAEVALFLKRAIVDPAFYERENATLNPFARGPSDANPHSVPPAADHS